MGREQICGFGAPFPRAAEGRNALALEYALLKNAVEAAAQAIGADKAEIAGLRRAAIARLDECAQAVFELAGVLEGAAQPSDAVSRYLGRGRGAEAGFAEQASEFLEYARSFMLNLAGGERDGGFHPARPAPASAGGFRERLESLSPSQKRAFDLLVKGLPNKLIAYQLGLAESTVKAHMSALFRKLEVRSRTHAIAVAASLERERSLVSEIASGVEILEGAPLAEPKSQPTAVSARTQMGVPKWPTR